jgi:hypothetical protein
MIGFPNEKEVESLRLQMFKCIVSLYLKPR